MALHPHRVAVTRIALDMLFADQTKFLGIVLGVSFASLLISHQSSTFCGLMLLTTGAIRDVEDAQLWVMHQDVESIAKTKPLRDTALQRVRGVSEVSWAVPFYKGRARARTRGGDFEQVILLGVDDTSLVGGPTDLLIGDLDDLHQPDAVIIDERGYSQVWPEAELEVGRRLEMNDRRAVIVGIAKASQTFDTAPVIYTTYSRAVSYAPPRRKVLSFVLAWSADGVDAQAAAAAIERDTGLMAQTRDQFFWKTIWYFLRETGIPFNFGITVALGFLVGTAIAGQTFYLFATENIKQFATLKAMGATPWQLIQMVSVQALVVGFIGYGIGVGLSAIFGQTVAQADRIAFYMPWPVLVGSGVAVLLICMFSAWISLRRILSVEPANVFRG